MPAIKLKKVTAEYLAEKEKAAEKDKEKGKKNLEEVVEGQDEEVETKPFNFLDVEVLWDKRKRTLPAAEQKLVEWLDANLESKTDVYLPLMTLYEYYSEVCQMQGSGVVDVPVFNRYIKLKFGKFFGFQDNSPYKVLIKERKQKEKKPKVEGEGVQLKLRDIIREVIESAGNPRKGLRFSIISKAIIQKYPAHKIGLTPKKLKSALERGIYFSHVLLVRGVGMCGYYRLPGEPTKEEEEEPAKVKDDEKPEDGENKESVENGSGETEDKEEAEEEGGGTKRKADAEESADASPKKKQKKKPTKKKKKPTEHKYRSEVDRHSNPQKVEDALPLAIAYQSDPKECSTSKIKHYISKFYRVDVNQDKLKKVLESGVEKGLWELTKGNAINGTYHLLIESFNPARSDNLPDQIAQALVACHEPKCASVGLIKKYITKYHPHLNIDTRPHLFKSALERAIKKGTIRQLSGVGASGSFQLVYQFYPSPAILAGDTSDDEEEEEEDDDEDEVGLDEYVPRPTKRGRIAKREQQSSVSSSTSRGRSAPPVSKKNKMKGKSAKSGKKGKKVENSESEDEVEAVDLEAYTPRKTKSRGGSASSTPRSQSKQPATKNKTPAKSLSPVKKSKSAAKAGKSAKKAAQKPGGKRQTPSKAADKAKASTPKKSPEKRPPVEDGSDDDEPISDQEEYVPKPSKRRGGATQDESPVKSDSKKSKSRRR